MATPGAAAAISGLSHLSCCQMEQAPPATARSTTDVDKAKAEFLPVRLLIGLSKVVAAGGRIARPLDSSPPHDVQSLFCTLLI
jgi:hypothetical protein